MIASAETPRPSEALPSRLTVPIAITNQARTLYFQVYGLVKEKKVAMVVVVNEAAMVVMSYIPNRETSSPSFDCP